MTDDTDARAREMAEAILSIIEDTKYRSDTSCWDRVEAIIAPLLAARAQAERERDEWKDKAAAYKEHVHNGENALQHVHRRAEAAEARAAALRKALERIRDEDTYKGVVTGATFLGDFGVIAHEALAADQAGASPPQPATAGGAPEGESGMDRWQREYNERLASWVPPETRTVPVNPTDTMIAAGEVALLQAYSESDWEEAKDVAEGLQLFAIYSAMIAAAPLYLPATAPQPAPDGRVRELASAREAALREAAAWHLAERGRLLRLSFRRASHEHETSAQAILALIDTPAAGAEAGGDDGR